MKLRAAIFDLFYTLVNFTEAQGAPTAEILGIDPLVWMTRGLEGSSQHHLGGETDPYKALRLVAHSIDPSIPHEKIIAAVETRRRRFRDALSHVRPEVLVALRRIRLSGMRTGLISNASFEEIRHWRQSPLANLIDVALFSCYERVVKPDITIYRRAADRLGLSPRECVFIGDGGSHEHEGARNAGMKTILILDLLRESFPDLAESRPRRDTDWVVNSFTDLLSILDIRCSDL